MPASPASRGGLSHIALRVAISLAALFATSLGWGFEPFVVRDIRIEGAQRTEPGTVFSYLPIKVGEMVTEDKAAAAVRALFATGFFKDVRLEEEDKVLVVYVEERPTIASLTIVGTKDIDAETLRKSLRDHGFGDGRVFDRSVLDRAEQELKRQYLTRGRYAVKVTTTVTPMERNRVGVTMNVEEGESARIREIRIIGNQAFTEKDLLEQFKLRTPGWMSWYTKNDQYSREKMTGDLEGLRSFYLDRGYLEFSVDSTQASISPDKEDVFLTIGITEGGVYRVKDVKIGGQLLGRDAELLALMQLKAGDIFSGRKLTDSQKAIGDRLGQLGYAFANVNAVPDIDRSRREVSFQVMVDPGRRVYVRRIAITGNLRTRDEIVRRELRQFESAWYDSELIRLSRERLNRLGYFTEVKIDSSPVPEAPDQVDLTVVVKEQPTGAVTFGVGLSSAEKIILSAGINQQNFLGTGKSVGLNVNTSRLARTIAVSVTDPYFTADGVSRSFDAYHRTYDASVLRLGNYKWITDGVGMRFGIPYTEIDRLSAGLSVEGNSLHINNASPQRFKDYVSEFGQNSLAFLGMTSWRRDSRDSAFAPTKGQMQSASVEFTLPGSDLNYAKAVYAHQWFYPVTREFTIALNGEFGTGRAYGSHVYPLFKNFYAGGIGSVRGFQQASLGPRDPVDGVPTGGQTRVVGNAEFLFPLAGTGEDRSFRTFFFVDAGNVYTAGSVDLGALRYSAGMGINWASPIGPLKLSWGRPLNQQPGDRLQAFQFQVGSGF